jgi:hypothetical protein
MRRATGGPSNSTQLRAFQKPFSGPSGAWRLMRLVRWGRPEGLLGQLRATLPTLPMPTLLIHGTRDVLPAAFAERAASLIPDSSLVMLDSGHFIPLDRPNEVAASLRCFFEENRTAMGPPMRVPKLGKLNAQVRTEVTDQRIRPAQMPTAVVS